MKIVLLCVVALVMLVQLPSEGEAQCCNSQTLRCGRRSEATYCNDCTDPTPCCATGSCNIFCCNCGGRCRRGRRGRSVNWWSDDVTERNGTGHDVIQDGDLDGDGRLSFSEAHHYVVKRGAYDGDTAEKMLMDMDVDNDRFFSPQEIES